VLNKWLYISYIVCFLCLHNTYAQKPELVLPLGHSSIIHDVVALSDNQYVLTASRDKTIKLWNVNEKKEIRSYEQHEDAVHALAVSANGKFFFSASADHTIKLWNIATAQVIKEFIHHRGAVKKLALSADNKFLLSYATDKSIQAVSLSTGEVVRNYEAYDEVVLLAATGNSTCISVDITGKCIERDINQPEPLRIIQLPEKIIHAFLRKNTLWLLTAKGELIQYDLQQNKQQPAGTLTDAASVFVFNNLTYAINKSGHIFLLDNAKAQRVATLPFSADAISVMPTAAILSSGNAVFSFNGTNAKPLLRGYSFNFNEADMHAQSGELIFAGRTNQIRLFNIINHTGSLRRAGQSEFLAAKFSGNDLILSGSRDGNVYVFKRSDRTYMNVLKGHSDIITDIDVWNDSLALTTSKDGTSAVWNLKTGARLFTLAAHRSMVTCGAFSADGKYIATGSTDSTVILWDAKTAKRLEIFPAQRTNGAQKIRYDNGKFYSFGINPSIVAIDAAAATSQIIDLKYNIWDALINNTDIISNAPNADIVMWLKETVSEKNRYTGHKRQANGFFRFNSFVVSTGFDQCVKFWDIHTSQPMASFYPIDSADWVVITPGGMFDASPGAMKLMYYVAGNEIIELSQLKSKYYEPNLLQKVLGISAEAARKVNTFEEVKLYPKVKLEWQNPEQQNGDLKITLYNQGGGIGKATMFINGKEVITDIRPQSVSESSDSLYLVLPTASYPFLKGGSNDIEVRAYNLDETIVSRGARIPLKQAVTNAVVKPSVYVVCIGTSDYEGSSIDLRYASKDATDIYRAINLSASKLFNRSQVFGYLITTDTASSYKPGKEQILQVLDEVSQKAKPEDLFLLYLSGHGINIGGADGDFYYLTQTAHSAQAEAYSDPQLRAKVGISSGELTEKLKQIRALKQVMMIDACASGRVVDNLVSKRDISSSALRALDRLKDRTGTHIITGCAADAVSYEASRYGQGLLTYSLLQGIKGASLRESEFVDVLPLLNFARERVPQIAAGIGGIQEPKVFSPYGAESFDIGQVSEDVRSSIPLAQAKPMFVRSTFIDVDESEDQLGLSKLIDGELNERSVSGAKGGSLVFLDVKDFPEAYKLSGTYKKHGDTFVLNMRIRSVDFDKKSALLANSIDDLKKQILAEIDKVVQD
jgi:WD40 repeat protein